MTANLFAELANRWDDTKSYLRRPTAWARDKLGEHMWSAQAKILRSVRDNRYTAVPSAHDMGKSKVAANAIAHWIDSHPPGEAFVVTTAPTAAQVSAILWREVAKNHKKANLDGRINRAGYPQWYMGAELVGYGRKPADYEQSAFQGIHARYVLVVIDEACGVARQLYDAVDALVTNENCRVLAIGNPDIPGSHFATICKPGSGWNVIQLDALRSPNMTRDIIVGEDPENPRYPLLNALMLAEGIPYTKEKVPFGLRDLLISPLWIEERIQRWAGLGVSVHTELTQEELQKLVQNRCAASPLFTAKVRGRFPDSSTDGVIPLGWIQLAINRWHDWNDSAAMDPSGNKFTAVPGRKVIGVDVARSGEDETAIAVRNGNVVREIRRFRMADTMETADAAGAFMDETGAMAVVDVIGIGAGVFDALRRMAAKRTIMGTAVPFNASAATPRKDMIGQFKFRNDRAAAWWKLRELLDPSRGSQICLPDDERMIEELVTVQYEMLVGGIIKIESKDDIRKRLGRSTDAADAVIQSFWVEGLDTRDIGEAVAYATNPNHHSGVVRYDGQSLVVPDDLEGSPGLPWATSEATGYGMGASLDNWNDDGWDL